MQFVDDTVCPGSSLTGSDEFEQAIPIMTRTAARATNRNIVLVSLIGLSPQF